MTLSELRIQLQEAGIPHIANAVTTYGSEYLSCYGRKYRLADHPKKSGNFGLVEIKDWNEARKGIIQDQEWILDKVENVTGDIGYIRGERIQLYSSLKK